MHVAVPQRPDVDEGEAAAVPILERSRPDGSTADVSFWTSRPVREVNRSHVNYVAADTRKDGSKLRPTTWTPTRPCAHS